MIEVKIQFPDKRWANVFWGWYLDGGGDEAFLQSLDDAGIAELGDTDQNWSKKTWTITHKLEV